MEIVLNQISELRKARNLLTLVFAPDKVKVKLDEQSRVGEIGPEFFVPHELLTTWALKKYPTKVVSEMLGHASVRTTLDICGHVLQEDFQAPLAEMAGKLLPDVAQNGGNQVTA